MQALFVHGMGRSPLSAWAMLWRLQAEGMKVSTFGYVVTFEDFTAIKKRLGVRIAELAKRGDYILIGHSLGGVLLRAALASLPADTRLPQHLFLLGSPVRPARLAQKLQNRRIYRVLTGDCGQLLSCGLRMSEVGSVPVPVTSIVGVAGLTGKASLFGDELNDAIISVSEARAEWIDEEICIPVLHTFLPMSRRVANIILERTVRFGSEEV